MDGVLVVQTEGTSSYRQRGPLIRLTPDLAESWMGMYVQGHQYHRRCHFHCHLPPDGLGRRSNGITAPTHDARLQQGKRPARLDARARAAFACGHGIMRSRDTLHALRANASLLMTSDSERSIDAHGAPILHIQQHYYKLRVNAREINCSCNGKDY